MSRLAAAIAVGVLAGVTAPDASAQGAGSASVEVDVDRRSLAQDEELVVTVTLEGTFDDYQQPRFGDFEVVGRPRESHQMQIINGRITRSRSLSYRLRPKRAGTLVIPPIKALAGGQVVAASKPVQVVVRKANTPPPRSPGQLPGIGQKASQSIFLQAEMPQRPVYVGEVFTITWQLYFRPNVGVQSVETVKAPKLQGLLAEELLKPDRNPRPREKVVQGRRFRYFPQSMQLVTGLQPGKVTVDQSTLRVSVGQLFSQKRYTVRGDPFTLDVRALPTQGRPPEFREGNIGRFNVTGSLRNADGAAPSTVQTGERLILEIVVSGEGNLVSLKPPAIDGGEGFDVQALPSTAEDVIEKDERGMHGKRVFQYLVSPRRPGEVVTPAAKLAFFDPTKGRYTSLEVPGSAITVAGRAIPDGASSAALAGDDIGAHIDQHTLTMGQRTTLAGSPLFWVLLLAPLFAYLGVETRHRIRTLRARNPEKRRARGAHGNARKRLALAERVLKDGLVKDFYGHVSRTITAYFEERAGLPAVGMTHDELRRAAVELGYAAQDVDDAIVELENCDFARFAPAASAEQQMRETLDRVAGLVQRLEKVTPGGKA